MACKAPFARYEDHMVQWASAATSALSLWCTDLGEGLLPELVEWMGWSDTDSEVQTDRKMISTPPSGELYGLSKMMNGKPTTKPWGLRVEEQTLEGQLESEINNVAEWRSDANVIQEQQKEKCTKGAFRRRIFEAARRTREASMKKVFGVLCVDDGLTQADLVEVDVDGTDLTRHRIVCRGITRARLRSDHLDEEALASIRASLFRLCQGQRPLAGLTVDLGYLWMKHQHALRQLVPRWLVLTTPLVQLPLIRTCFRTVDATLLVVWEDASVSELSWLEASSNIRIDGQVEVIVVRASQPESAWSSFPDQKQAQAPLLLDLVERVQIRLAELSRKDVAVSSILVDGALSRFSKGLRNATQLPVFDEVSMMGLFSAASSLSEFSEASVLGRLEDKLQRIGNGQNSVRGRVTEGQLGLVQLDSYEYVRAVGDADHESTFSFQTNPRVAQGLSFEKAQTAAQEPVMLESLRQAAKEMETAHCFGIAGNCGFMQFYQALVREAVSVPVFLSALVQVPTMAAALDPRDRILILTANETSFREAQELLLRAECCNMALDQIVVRGCEDVPGFEAVAKMEQVDTQKVENSLSQFVEEILAEGDGAFIKMIVLECTELPHYAARLRRVSGLPVLDLVTCANFFAKVLVGSF
ncbi:ALMA6 [Symbiodinium sp. CCMP2592]|nr:ALMA6 [Symbiodinium sp. CCMP2592]